MHLQAWSKPRASARFDFIRLSLGGFALAMALLGAAPSAAVEFTTRFDAVPLGGTPQALAVGDVNGDGRPDLAVALAEKAGEPDSLVRIYVNDGKGGFASKADVRVAAAPAGLVLADFDGDGKLDLGAACSGAGKLTLVRGKGDATFAGRQDVGIGVRPVGVISSDLDGDGAVELVTVALGTGKPRPSALQAVASGDTAWTDSSAVTVIGFERGGKAPARRGAASAGAFRLRPARVLPRTAQPIAVAAGDWNGDGRVDVAAATRGAGFVVWTGAADGSFAPPRELPVQDMLPNDVVFTDLGKDGKLDLVGLVTQAAQPGGGDRFALAIASGGTETWRIVPFDGPAPSRLRFADLDQDGTVDAAVLARNRITILPGKPDGSFGTPRAYAADVAVGFEVASLDGDAAPDLVALSQRGSGLVFFPANGDGSFGNSQVLPVGLSPAAIAGADLNGDGKADLATANNASADVSLLLTGKDGSFAPEVRLEATEGPSAIHAVDLNGDRAADLVVLCMRQRASQLLYYRNRGDGSFHPRVTLSSGIDPSTLFVVDANEDKKPDLVVPRANQSEIALYLGKGDGSFESPRRLAVSHLPTISTTGDLNGDAHIDLAVCDPRAGGLTLFLGKGDGTFNAAPPIKARGEPVALALADATGDGKTDLILVPKRGLFTGSVLHGNGDGTFGGRTDFTVTMGAGFPYVGDIDGDNRLDMVTADVFSGCISVLRGAAAGGFEKGVEFGSGPDPTSIAALDYDGDGNTDLAVPNRAGNAVVLHRNLGSK